MPRESTALGRGQRDFRWCGIANRGGKMLILTATYDVQRQEQRVLLT